MKSDRNEAITKNDQFLIIYSGRGRGWGGQQGSENTKCCSEMHRSGFCNILQSGSGGENKLCFGAQT